MDLELSDEQTWLSESVETLLERNWPAPADVAVADAHVRRALWDNLVAFGALDVGGEGGLGAVEMVLVARALGAHLASVPYVGSAAARFAAVPVEAGHAVSVAALERGGGWTLTAPQTTIETDGVHGEKVAVEHTGEIDRLAVVASQDGEAVLALVDPAVSDVLVRPQKSLDPTVPFNAVRFQGAAAADVAGGSSTVHRLMTAGALLAAAEAVGAAGAVLEEARGYAGERRQFGRTIGSFQALRHVLSDMYVRHASAWSTVLFAAASLDDEALDAAHTVSIAKAYAGRATREVVHGAMQVFGGIAFTDEHPAHRFLRRTIVRDQQFGDAAHHERLLGRALADRVADRRMELSAP